jgi:hypothetical protein
MLLPRIWCRGRIYSTRNGFDKSNPYINLETGGSILVKTGIYLFYSLVPLGTMYRAPTSDSWLLASGSFYSRDTRHDFILTPEYWLLTSIFLTRYDSRDTNLASGSRILDSILYLFNYSPLPPQIPANFLKNIFIF